MYFLFYKFVLMMLSNHKSKMSKDLKYVEKINVGKNSINVKFYKTFVN